MNEERYVVAGLLPGKPSLYLIMRFASGAWHSQWCGDPNEATKYLSEPDGWGALKRSGCGGPAGYNVITMAEALELARGAAV